MWKIDFKGGILDDKVNIDYIFVAVHHFTNGWKLKEILANRQKEYKGHKGTNNW